MKNEREKVIKVSMYTVAGPRVVIDETEFVKLESTNKPVGYLSGGIGCSAPGCLFQDLTAGTVAAKHASFAAHAASEHHGERGKVRSVTLWQVDPDFEPPPRPKMDSQYHFIE